MCYPPSWSATEAPRRLDAAVAAGLAKACAEREAGFFCSAPIESIVHNVIAALNSNTTIAPNYRIDHKTGNDYFLTVQYYENGRPAIHDFADSRNIPLRAANLMRPTTLDTVVSIKKLVTPTAAYLLVYARRNP